MTRALAAQSSPDVAALAQLGLSDASASRGARRARSFGLGLTVILGVASAFGSTGCQGAAGPVEELSGKQVYDRHCARCHGFDGRPTKASPGARDLTNRSYIDSLGDKKIRAAVMQGRPPMGPGQPMAMPAFGTQFSEPEYKVLIGYVRSLSNPELGPARLSASESEPGPEPEQKPE